MTFNFSLFTSMAILRGFVCGAILLYAVSCGLARETLYLFSTILLSGCVFDALLGRYARLGGASAWTNAVCLAFSSVLVLIYCMDDVSSDTLPLFATALCIVEMLRTLANLHWFRSAELAAKRANDLVLIYSYIIRHYHTSNELRKAWSTHVCRCAPEFSDDDPFEKYCFHLGQHWADMQHPLREFITSKHPEDYQAFMEE